MKRWIRESYKDNRGSAIITALVVSTVLMVLCLSLIYVAYSLFLSTTSSSSDISQREMLNTAAKALGEEICASELSIKQETDSNASLTTNSNFGDYLFDLICENIGIEGIDNSRFYKITSIGGYRVVAQIYWDLPENASSSDLSTVEKTILHIIYILYKSNGEILCKTEKSYILKSALTFSNNSSSNSENTTGNESEKFTIKLMNSVVNTNGNNGNGNGNSNGNGHGNGNHGGNTKKNPPSEEFLPHDLIFTDTNKTINQVCSEIDSGLFDISQWDWYKTDNTTDESEKIDVNKKINELGLTFTNKETTIYAVWNQNYYKNNNPRAIWFVANDKPIGWIAVSPNTNLGSGASVLSGSDPDQNDISEDGIKSIIEAFTATVESLYPDETFKYWKAYNIEYPNGTDIKNIKNANYDTIVYAIFTSNTSETVAPWSGKPARYNDPISGSPVKAWYWKTITNDNIN